MMDKTENSTALVQFSVMCQVFLVFFSAFYFVAPNLVRFESIMSACTTNVTSDKCDLFATA